MPADMTTTPHRGYHVPNADPEDLIPQLQAMLTDIDNDVNTITGGAPATLADPGSNGIVVRTSTSVTVARTLTGTANQISVASGDGVSGNPTLSVPANAQLSIAKLTNLTSNGFVKTGSSDGSLSIDTNSYLNTSLADGKIYVGNGSGIGTAVTPSGDVTISNAGVTAIGALKVLNSMIANSTIDLTAKVTGVLPIANGGTNKNSWTTGSIPYFDGTRLQEDNANFFWDASNHRLAIGNVSPNAPLDVTGRIVAKGFSFNANQAIDANYSITSPSAFAMAFGPNGSEIIRITSAGNVGISTTTPSSKLSINGGLHVGGDSDAGDNNLLVDGTGNFAGDLLLSASTANLFLKNTSTGFRSSTDLIVNPQPNNSFRSTSFTSGLVGWAIDEVGNAEFANGTFRGAIRTAVLLYNQIQATAGTQIVTKSAGKLKSNVVVPASPTYGTTSVNIDITDQDGVSHATSQLFASGDILRLKDGLVGDTWFSISSVSDQTTFWRYVCTLQAGTNNVTYSAGLGVADYGISGSGFLFQTADQANAPYLQMATINATPLTSNDASGTLAITPQLRLGNLKGSYGYGADVYGLGAGQYGTASKSWITVEQTNGFRVGNNTTVRAQVAIEGSGFFANNLFSFDSSGNVSISGNAAIGGFAVGSDYLRDSANSFGLASTVTGGDDVRFWAGDTFANRSTAAFRVTEAGVLNATNATITGTVNANAGNFSGVALTGLMTMSGASSAITIGLTPPTSASAGTGLWLDRTGLYALNANVVKASVTTVGITAGPVGLSNGGLITSGTTPNITINSLGLTATTYLGTSADGIILQSGNTGSSQYSPRLRLSGNYYRTASATNTEIDFIQEAQPATAGAGNPSASPQLWVLSYGTSNAGYSAVLKVDGNTGNLTTPGTITVGSGPTTLTDSAGKILSAALNTVAVAQGGTGGTTAATGRAGLGLDTGDTPQFTRLGLGVAADASVAFQVTSASSPQAQFQADGSASRIRLQTGSANFFEFWKDGSPTKGASIGMSSPSDGTLTADLRFSLFTGSAWIEGGRFYNDGGLVIGTPTGASKGAGSINAVTVWRNGTSLDSVFDTDYKLLSIDDMGEFVKLNHHLPTIPTKEVNQNGSTNLGALEDRLWETTENHALYIMQLNDEIKTLKARVADLEKRRN